MNDIDTRVNDLERTVLSLGHDLNEARRLIDLLLVNDPESEVRKHFVERAKKTLEHREKLNKAREQLRQLQSAMNDIVYEHPELR